MPPMKLKLLLILPLALGVGLAANAATVHDISKLGANGDGKTVNTKIIQDAINACAPGDTVLIPAGTFVSGALFLKSDMTLEIDGTLKGSTDIKDYPLIPCRYEGFELNCYASLLTLGKRDHSGPYNITNVVITGTGTIDGSGQQLGAAEKAKSGNRTRGRVICMMNAQNITVSNLTVSYGPAWTVHPIYSDHLLFTGLKLISKNSTYRIANGDGIDPDSCTYVTITNCYFHTGDDSIAIKSGKNLEGYDIGKPSEHILVTGCTVDGSNGGIVIGSEMSGSVRDVLVMNCVIKHTSWEGLDIKSSAGRGGTVENVTFANNNEAFVRTGVRITTAYKVNNDGAPAPVPPTLKNITVENINCTEGAAQAIEIAGLPNAPVSNVHFSNCSFVSKAGATVDDADDVTFTHVVIKNNVGPKFTVTDSQNVTGAEN
ncbi:MAG TPA: glycoside hydrolase family 28 protein [Candidatus Aquilonibacter sp.]|nr:glycoside hydrolase family 28 protein [Candidatus Aquilonibacter sp.]